jgi:chromosome partitioning protein
LVSIFFVYLLANKLDTLVSMLYTLEKHSIMAQYQIGLISQKGGVGKSTISRLLLREYTLAGWNAKIADMDVKQGTSVEWNMRRKQNEQEPELSVEAYSRVDKALKDSDNLDLLIFDGQARSDSQTKEIANNSDMLILPTSTALDDLEPTVRLANDLKKAGIAPERIYFALSKVGNQEHENEEAEEYLKYACARAGYKIVDGRIPEMLSIRKALDSGKAPSEISYPSVRGRIYDFTQSIIDNFEKTINK